MKISTLIVLLIATGYAAAGWLPTSASSALAEVSSSIEDVSLQAGTPSPTPQCFSWQSMTPYPTPIAEMSAVTDGTSAYVFGGRSFQTLTGQVNRYDPVTDTWSPLADMPNGTFTRLVADYGYNGKIYVIGGTTGPQTSNTRIYDIATNTWSYGRAGVAGGNSAAHAFVNGRIYII